MVLKFLSSVDYYTSQVMVMAILLYITTLASSYLFYMLSPRNIQVLWTMVAVASHPGASHPKII